jgi:hypothetical protein
MDGLKHALVTTPDKIVLQSDFSNLLMKISNVQQDFQVEKD